MKYVIVILLTCFSKMSFANLYLQTEYQEGKKPKIVSKQHIFLNKREPVNYSKKGYVLILQKITKDEATIETESYDIDKIGHKTMHGGSYGTYKLGKSFNITDHGPKGEVLFNLKIVLEKIVPTIP